MAEENGVRIDTWLKERAAASGEAGQRVWLARELRVSKTTVDNWCQGNTMPHPSHLRAIEVLSEGRVTADAVFRHWKDRQDQRDTALDAAV